MRKSHYLPRLHVTRYIVTIVSVLYLKFEDVRTNYLSRRSPALCFLRTAWRCRDSSDYSRKFWGGTAIAGLFGGAWLGAMFCHPHFRGRLLNDPRSQPHANPPAAHSSPSHFLDALAAPHSPVLLSSTLSILQRAGFSTLTTVNSELRLHLLSLHVARLTNLIDPPATNWRK